MSRQHLNVMLCTKLWYSNFSLRCIECLNMTNSSLTQEVKRHAMLMALTVNHSDSVCLSWLGDQEDWLHRPDGVYLWWCIPISHNFWWPWGLCAITAMLCCPQCFNATICMLMLNTVFNLCIEQVVVCIPAGQQSLLNSSHDPGVAGWELSCLYYLLDWFHHLIYYIRAIVNMETNQQPHNTWNSWKATIENMVGWVVYNK